MRDLFEALIADGEVGIARLLEDRQQENVELEFKTKAAPHKGDLTKEDRNNLAETLSALSNSMGGLMIWGMIARKNADGVDCATEAAPISEIEKFSAEVVRMLSQAIMPRHDGIRVAVIRTAADASRGYLAIHVERSERRPHRSEFGNKQYFKRVGDSSIAMEHYDIEDGFKRLVVPWLNVEVGIIDAARRGGPDDYTRTVRFVLWLRNPSPVSARYPYLILDRTAVSPGSPFSARSSFLGGADDVVHPTLALKAIEANQEYHALRGPDRERLLFNGAALAPIVIKYRCGCYNSQPKNGELTITEKQIVDALSAS